LSQIVVLNSGEDGKVTAIDAVVHVPQVAAAIVQVKEVHCPVHDDGAVIPPQFVKAKAEVGTVVSGELLFTAHTIAGKMLIEAASCPVTFELLQPDQFTCPNPCNSLPAPKTA